MRRTIFCTFVLLSVLDTGAVLADSAGDQLVAELKAIAQNSARPLSARLNAIDMLGKLGAKDAAPAVKALDDLLAELSSAPAPLVSPPSACELSSIAPPVSYAIGSSEPQSFAAANEASTAPPKHAIVPPAPAPIVKPPAKGPGPRFDTNIRALYLIRSLGNYGPAARYSLAHVARFSGLDHTLDRVIATTEQSLLIAEFVAPSAPTRSVPPPPQPLAP